MVEDDSVQNLFSRDHGHGNDGYIRMAEEAMDKTMYLHQQIKKHIVRWESLH